MSDAAWLAQLLESGLLRGSFVPPPVIAQLRDLTRYRKKLVDRTRETQRVQKALEDAGIELSLARAPLPGRGRLGAAAPLGDRCHNAMPAADSPNSPRIRGSTRAMTPSQEQPSSILSLPCKRRRGRLGLAAHATDGGHAPMRSLLSRVIRRLPHWLKHAIGSPPIEGDDRYQVPVL